MTIEARAVPIRVRHLLPCLLLASTVALAAGQTVLGLNAPALDAAGKAAFVFYDADGTKRGEGQALSQSDVEGLDILDWAGGRLVLVRLRGRTEPVWLRADWLSLSGGGSTPCVAALPGGSEDRQIDGIAGMGGDCETETR